MNKLPNTNAETHPQSRRRRRQLIVLIAVLGVCAIAGGGYLANQSVRSGAGASATAAADRNSVHAAVTAYARSLSRQDGATVCQLLSPAAARAATANISPVGHGNCPSAVLHALRQLPSRILPEIGSGRVTNVRVAGEYSTATFLVGSRSIPVSVTRIYGHWRLALGTEAPSVTAGVTACPDQFNRVVSALALPAQMSNC